MNQTSIPQEGQTLGTAPIVDSGTAEPLESRTGETARTMERTREDARKVKDKATAMASEYATAGKDKASNALESLARLMRDAATRSEEHTSELQSLMRISYAVFCLKKKQKNKKTNISRLTQVAQ